MGSHTLAGVSGMKIRVLVADDFPLFLDGVCAALEADRAFDVVARAANGTEAAERAAETAPDVVLMDMMMPGSTGGASIELVRERAPDTRVLAISASERIDMMQEAFRAGASGYVTKFARPRELREALVEVHGGGRVVSPALARHVLRPDPAQGAEGQLAGSGGPPEPTRERGAPAGGRGTGRRRGGGRAGCARADRAEPPRAGAGEDRRAPQVRARDLGHAARRSLNGRCAPGQPGASASPPALRNSAPPVARPRNHMRTNGSGAVGSSG